MIVIRLHYILKEICISSTRLHSRLHHFPNLSILLCKRCSGPHAFPFLNQRFNDRLNNRIDFSVDRCLDQRFLKGETRFHSMTQSPHRDDVHFSTDPNSL